MARTFNGGVSSDFQLNSAFGLTDEPITIVCWFKRTATGTDGPLVSISNGDGNPVSLKMFVIYFTADGRVLSQTFATSSGLHYENSNDTNWHHMIGQFVSNTNRRSYIDGTSANAADTTSISASSTSQVNIGVINEAYGGTYAAAAISSMAGWSISDLSAEEKMSLAKGFSPRRIRPQSLAFYIPAVRENVEWRTREPFITTGGTVSDHPRTYGM